MGDSAEMQVPPEGTPTGTVSNGAAAAPPVPSTVGVRYGFMKYVGEFSFAPQLELDYDSRVVVQTDRGMEMGEVLPLTCARCPNVVSTDRIQAYVAESGADYYRRNCGRILRRAKDEDIAEHEHLQAGGREKLDFCAERAREHELPMELVQCEHLFGGERIVFYFKAEGRIDFRGLVKDLAHEYQTRIEMRQVGARDEARLVADYETCGRECCCRAFLKSLRPVTMKMAKLQKATLDPSKVSGRCGRLKCCLRYEHVTYDELDRALPRMGQRLETPEGSGVVVDRQLLTQLVMIATEDGGRVAVPLEVIRGDRPRPTGPAEPEDTFELAGMLDGEEWEAPEVEESTPSAGTSVPARAVGSPPATPGAAESGETPKKKRRRRRRRRKPGGAENAGGQEEASPDSGPPAA